MTTTSRPSPAAPAPERRPRGQRPHRLHRFCAASIAVAVIGISVGILRSGPTTIGTMADVPGTDPYSVVRLSDPDRTVVRDGGGVPVATLTDGSRTVNVVGPSRTFADPQFTSATVTTTAWVRLLPAPWTPGADTQPWFRPWLDSTLHDTSPDALAIGMQYTIGAPDRYDANGLRIAGDAGFGPPDESQTSRAENSDFYDYLGVPWSFSDGRVEQPDPTHARDVDCSGFLRLVWGYRMGYPLRDTDAPGPGLPRRARGIAEVGPGNIIIADRNQPASEYERLQPGDLVFFNIDPSVDPRVDHSGIYLGIDDSGHHRFLSSRGKANGPTFGDLGGNSVLDDGQHYSQAFRVARRI